MAYNPYIKQYAGNQLQGSGSLLQGSSPAVQGSSPSIQNNPQPAPVTTYGNNAATSPAKQKYINDLSGQYGLSDGTVYNKQTNTGLDLDAFKKATGIQNPDWSSLKFDTGYTPMSVNTPTAGFMPLNAPSSMSPSGSTPTPTVQTPKADPYAGYKTAYDKYINSLAPSEDYLAAKTKYLDFVNNAQTGIANLEGQGRGIPLGLVRGQQAKLAEQSELTANRLQDDVTLASERARMSQDMAKAGVDFQKGLADQAIADEDRALSRAEKTLASTAPALLAQLGTLKTQQEKDSYITQKAQELGLSIDQVNSALQGAMPAKGAPIKLGEGDTLYDPTTGKVVFSVPKTYAPGSGSSSGGGILGLSNQQIDNISPLVTQYQNNDIVKNYTTIGTTLNSVRSLGGTPTDDIQRIYAFAKVMDPTSVVREGEYKTIQDYSAALLQRAGLNAKRVFTNSGFLTDEARGFLLNTLENNFKSAEQTYKQLTSETARRINLIGGTDKGDQLLNNYGGAFTPASGSGSGGGDPLGIR